MGTDPLQTAAADLTAALPGAQVAIDRHFVTVLDAGGRTEWVRGTTLHAAAVHADLALETERGRALGRKSPVQEYADFTSKVRAIQAYREINPEFERLLFHDPVNSACTEGKAVVVRPEALADTQYEQLQRRCLPPFEWFLSSANAGRAGQPRGAWQLAKAIAENLLEGGICGYWASFGTERIGGVAWRVPKIVRVYSGTQLGAADPQDDPNLQERWYLRRQKGNQSNGVYGSKPSFDDESQWTELVDDPERGVYRGVWKLGGTAGKESIWPTPPWAAGLDPCLGDEMTLRDDLSTLAFQQRSVTIWSFDFEAMKNIPIPWADQRDSEGNVVVEGAMTQFLDARQAVIENASTGGSEYVLPSYIKREYYTTSLDFLKEINRYRPFRERIYALAGLLFDWDGKFLEKESKRRQQSDFTDLRGTVALALNDVFAAIAAENAAKWGNLNRLGSMNPLAWETPAWKRWRQRRRRDGALSIEQQQARQLAEIELLLRGEAGEATVRFEFVPASLDRAADAQWANAAVDKGNISEETYHETLGLDHDLERARMLRQKTLDRVTPDPATQSLWMPDPTYTQMAVRPDGTVSTTGQQISDGRPPEGGGEAMGDGR